jgi:hypothetical protein
VLKVTGGYEVAEVFADGVVITAMHSHARRDEDFAWSLTVSRTARISASGLSPARVR